MIHNHVDCAAFPFARLSATPTVTTTHGRLDREVTRRIFGRFPEQRLVSISDAQRDRLPDARWLATVYNGLDLDRFWLRTEPGDCLLFLGRVNPEKRPDRAIEIARESAGGARRPLIESQGGSIAIAGVEGAGTTVTVRLPV